MPQFTGTFVIKDGSATPADVSYQPEKLGSDNTILVDRREASRDLQPSLNIDYERPVPQRKSYKQTLRALLPRAQLVNGVLVATDPLRAKLEFVLPQASTVQERKHLHAMIVNAANHALLKVGATDLDPLY